MFKELLVAMGNPQRERSEAIAYIAEHHGPLALSVPSIRDALQGYGFNEVLDDDVPAETPYRRDTAPLVVVEHVCVSEAAMLGTLDDPAYVAQVRPDEEHMTRTYMSGLPKAYCLAEHVVLDAQPAGRYRLLDFLVRRPDADADVFREGLEADAARVRDDPAARAAVRQRIDNVVRAHEPLIVPFVTDCDAIVESWFDELDDLSRAAETLRVSREGFVDGERSWSIVVRNRPLIPRSVTAVR